MVNNYDCSHFFFVCVLTFIYNTPIRGNRTKKIKKTIKFKTKYHPTRTSD